MHIVPIINPKEVIKISKNQDPDKDYEFQMVVESITPKYDKHSVPSYKLVKLKEIGTTSVLQIRVDPEEHFFKEFHSFGVNAVIEDLGPTKPKTVEDKDREKDAKHPDQKKLV